MLANDFFGETLIGEVKSKTPQGHCFSCKIRERFEPIVTRTFKCGVGFKRTITRRVGVSKEDHEKLEDFIESGLGVESIALLKAKIAEEIKITLKLEMLEEVEEEFTFQVDQCDQRYMQLCQKKRIYEFECQIARWFGFMKHRYNFTIVEWLDDIFERCFITRYHPDCNCKEEVQHPLGFVVVRIGEKIALTLPYFKTKDPYFKTIERYVVSIVNLHFHDKAQLFQYQGKILSSDIPKYLSFLSRQGRSGDLPIIVSDVSSYDPIEELTEALRDAHKDFRKRVVDALGAQLQGREAVEREPRESRTSILRMALINLLWGVLRDPDKDLRNAAAYALGELGVGAVPALMDWWVRFLAHALGKGGAPAVPPLIDALRDADDKDLRNAAAYALGELGDARAVPPLIDALRDPDKDVRNAAAETLRKLGWQPPPPDQQKRKVG